MPSVRFAAPAAADLERISDYLELTRPTSRIATLNNIFAALSSLKRYPHSGRPGLVLGTRELVLTPLPYIAVYHLVSGYIEVLRIYHGAQDRSP